MKLTPEPTSFALEILSHLTPALDKLGNKLGQLIDETIDTVVDAVIPEKSK
jgi:hypothetical protein